MANPILKTVKKFIPIWKEAKEKDLIEANVVTRIIKFLEEGLGYDVLKHITKEFQIKEKFVDLAIKEKGVKISKVILFGSYAKGIAKPDSDIDLAVISSQFGKDNLKEMIFLRKLAIKIDSHIEPLPFSPEDLKDRYSTLTNEINNFGIII